jgi:6-phosphofructokinase 1
MGRHGGFIAAHACLANPDANFCLVPEVPFPIEGEGGLLWALERRLEARRHAVLVVAEGAARDVLQGPGAPRDASGKLRLRGGLRRRGPMGLAAPPEGNCGASA